MDIILEKESLCFLQLFPEMTTPKLKALYRHFGSYHSAVRGKNTEYKGIFSDDELYRYLQYRETRDIKYAINSLSAEGIGYYTLDDPEYPALLKQISSPPLSLFVKGRLPDNKLPSVAIIGARNCSGYGRQMAREYGRELAANGIQVISGLARGIDGMSQQAALSVSGESFAVLGCGVDICYPKENWELYENLCVRGGVISEYRPGTQPIAQFFPARNRIISGICSAVIVIEARERSGTLITVNMALDQGKDIYALPGRTTDSLSYGCNMLIRDGATPLLRPHEFIDEFYARLGINRQINKAPDNYMQSSEFLTADERDVIAVLDYHPKSINEIYYELSDKKDVNLAVLMGLLTDMTLKKKIRCIDGSNYYLDNKK